jgi:hypothetical protein
MWPWFSSPFHRWVNNRLLRCGLSKLIETLPAPPIGITTIPIVADLMHSLPVAGWVYYCVDDFGTWPGVDHAAMTQMEQHLVARADRIIAVSETLQGKISALGRESSLLTHGIDLNLWQKVGATETLPCVQGLERPLIIFWGVVDRRMDTTFVHRLANDLDRGTILMVGPTCAPDSSLYASKSVLQVPPVAYEHLPKLAQAANVLIMPYADLPVTQAMQPLKLKEYLATEKPVIVRDLPATRAWADCLDVADSPEAFSRLVRLRLATGLPSEQLSARARLADETWTAKAIAFERYIGKIEPQTGLRHSSYSAA